METMAAAPVAKPNLTLPVWKLFGLRPNEKAEPVNKDEAACNNFIPE